MQDGLGQIAGVGGCADLIVYDIDFVFIQTFLNHGLDEVLLAVRRVQPCRADDDGQASGSLDGQLSGQLSLSWYGVRFLPSKTKSVDMCIR